MKKTLKFIDLFAGIGGFRLGFEQGCNDLGLTGDCVFTSEIKDHALKVYMDNFPDAEIEGDITKIKSSEIPNFDVLLAGFPCQAFSSAGKRHGFADTRGTLFFEIERILKDKKPSYFILENVEGLVSHDKQNSTDSIGRTLSIILEKLHLLNYKVSWKVFNAKDFGLPQSRKRIFIVGSMKRKIDLDDIELNINVKLSDILEKNKPLLKSKLATLLMKQYKLKDLHGKAIKDKRGGKDNIHSWDIGLKGEVSEEQNNLLNELLKARRNKKWGASKGIAWMDGMPLTIKEIKTFYDHSSLEKMLNDLVKKDYVKFEHPKDLVEVIENGKKKKIRLPRSDLPKGYNIVAGKLSFEISKILDPNDIAPTLVATDLDRVVVTDKKGLRTLTTIEQCRLFGFPDSFEFKISKRLIHDLFGNSLPVPIVREIAKRMLQSVSATKGKHKNDIKSLKNTPFIAEAVETV